MLHVLFEMLQSADYCVFYGNNEEELFASGFTDGRYADIKYGIKLCNKNIGFNGQFYTFPYFLTFLIKRWLGKKV